MTTRRWSKATQWRKAVSLKDVKHDNVESLKSFVKNDLGCINPGSTLNKRQELRAGYLLLLGVDVLAANNFVEPSTGKIVASAALCANINHKFKKPHNNKTGTLINVLNYLQSPRQIPADILKIINTTSQLIGLVVLGLMALYNFSSREAAVLINASLLANAVQTGREFINYTDSRKRSLQQVIQDAANALSFKNGLSEQDLNARDLFRDELREFDIEIYKLQKSPPEQLLTQVGTSDKSKNSWALVAHNVNAILANCKQISDPIISVQCMRRQLIKNSHTNTMFKASMVFDSVGRLRTTEDIARSFYVLYSMYEKYITDNAGRARQ